MKGLLGRKTQQLHDSPHTWRGQAFTKLAVNDFANQRAKFQIHLLRRFVPQRIGDPARIWLNLF
jgi:hypothetical protein